MKESPAFWAVGASFGAQNDKTAEFKNSGEWYDGYAAAGDNRNRDVLDEVKVDDILVMKSSSTKGLGHKISFTKIKAIGIVQEKLDYYRFRVKWLDIPDLPRDFDGLWYALTIERLRQDDIFAFAKNITMQLERDKVLSLLRFKKQIVLQGPPGTGKTKLAKELAAQLTGIPINSKSNLLTDADIAHALENISALPSVVGQVDYTVVHVDEARREVTLKKSTDTEATTSFDKIRQFYKDDFWKQPTTSNDDRRAAAISCFIAQSRRPQEKLEETEQIKLVQFHPSFSYEDFVRGISAKPNDKGDGILYEGENRLLGKFVKAAEKNHYESSGSDNRSLDRLWLDDIFNQFVDHINERLTTVADHRIPLPGILGIVEVGTDAFEIKSERWSEKIKFSELKKLYKYNIETKAQVRSHSDIVGTVYHRTAYYLPILQMFRNFVTEYPQSANRKLVKQKDYVLIIDEINRANLSSVLGELIYALEYRGEEVESIYEVDGSNKLILPPNLYIIGTMNTADRSVGHIDYAIRRRFAFVHVSPKDLTAELGVKFHKILFDKVALMFQYDTNLSKEFDAEDVQLGHSYFIDKSEDGGSMDVRLEYEIKPILREYIKDGILVGEGIADSIESLTV